MAKVGQKDKDIEAGPPNAGTTPLQPIPSSGDVNFALGKLTQSVGRLEADCQRHADDIGKLKQSVHGAKVAMTVISVVAGVLGSVVGYFMKLAVDYWSKNPGKP